jgi:hypothetical protein
LDPNGFFGDIFATARAAPSFSAGKRLNLQAKEGGAQLSTFNPQQFLHSVRQ